MRKQKIFSKTILALSLSSTIPSHAATINFVWDQTKDLPILNQFYFDNKTVNALPENIYLFKSSNKQSNNPQQFKLTHADVIKQVSHIHYAQYYHDIPVWGIDIISHHKTHTKITGMIVTDIDKDISSTVPTLTIKAAEQQVLHYANKHYRKLSINPTLQTTLIIYFEPSNKKSLTAKARLAYLTTFFAEDESNRHLMQPVYIIDANNGSLLENYDNIKSDQKSNHILAAQGTGPGGNNISGLQMRSTNQYQFGNNGNLPQFGFVPIQINTSNNSCTMENNQLRLSSFENTTSRPNTFPITYDREPAYPVFSYSCTAASFYANTDDGGFAPIVNGNYTAYSPSNDVYYFGNAMYGLMQNLLPEISNYWGINLPVRTYNHIAYADDAFAVPGNDAGGKEPDILVGPYNSQVIFGNGNELFYPLTSSEVVGHELSHIFTAYHAGLIYKNQSGGIDEAYSDIAGITLNYSLYLSYPWYGFNWEIGASITLPNGDLGGKALRYMNNPPLDGDSIDNAANFIPGMDVHNSSGVYNYAFYLMVTKYGINIFKAYQYFSLANAEYWNRRSDFDHASCGVMQVAIDTDNMNDFDGIENAFEDVGVHCMVGLKKLKSTF